MTCKNCHTPIKESDNYCATCGFNLQTNQSPQVMETNLSPQQQKTYDKAITRLEQRMTRPTEKQEGQYLFWTGLTLSGFWIINQLVAYMVPGGFLSQVYAIVITFEAAIPLLLSFFVYQPKHKTVLRVLGSALLFVFIYQYFF